MSTGVIIYVIVMVIGALVKRYEKQQKEAQRRMQNRPLTRPNLNSMASSQPIQPKAAMPSKNPGQTARTRPVPALSGTMPPIVARPQDLREFTFDEEWLHQELEKSMERDLQPEVPGVVKPLPETGRKEVIHTETEDAEIFWQSGGKNHPREVSKVELAPQKPELLPPRLTREALIQGIVLSEVLQPPRARRPYRPIYMDRDK